MRCRRSRSPEPKRLKRKASPAAKAITGPEAAKKPREGCKERKEGVKEPCEGFKASLPFAEFFLTLK